MKNLTKRVSKIAKMMKCGCGNLVSQDYFNDKRAVLKENAKCEKCGVSMGEYKPHILSW